MNSQNYDEIQPVESDREFFTSATYVFMSSFGEAQTSPKAEFGPYFEYLSDPKSRTSISYYRENGGLLYRFFLTGHLRKISTFRDQLVIHAMSGGRLAYKHTFDKLRDRFWWPTLHHDVKTWCRHCQAYQRRKSPHRRAKLPAGHLPVDHPFQRVSIDLIE